MSEDRTVHACTDDMDVVRYGRAGKWYLEPRNRTLLLPRRAVSVSAAASYAAWGLQEGPNGVVHFGRLGGSTFDRKVNVELGLR